MCMSYSRDGQLHADSCLRHVSHTWIILALVEIAGPIEGNSKDEQLTS